MPNAFSTAIMIAIVAVVGGVLLAIIALTRGHGKVLNKERYRTAWLEIDNNIDRDNLASYQFAILRRNQTSYLAILMEFGRRIKCAIGLLTRWMARLINPWPLGCWRYIRKPCGI